MTTPNPDPTDRCAEFVPDVPRAPGLCATCGDDRRWHRDASPAPLSPEREAIIRQQQPGDWLSGAWTIRETETADGDVWQVMHQGQVLATLPDWAGNLALWIAETHEDVPELLATLDEFRAAAEAAEAKLRKIEHGCETPESHLYGCPCDTEGGAR